jgi:hypothetical protein
MIMRPFLYTCDEWNVPATIERSRSGPPNLEADPGVFVVYACPPYMEKSSGKTRSY